MNIVKGILKYALILIALVVGAAFVLGAIMVLAPSVTILGVKYAHIELGDEGYQVLNVNTSKDVTSLEIDAADYNVEVVVGEFDTLRVDIKLDAMGFYKAQYNETIEDGETVQEEKSIQEIFLPQTNIATMNNGTPSNKVTIKAGKVEGLLNFTKRSIKVMLPEDKDALNNINITTVDGEVDLTGIRGYNVNLKTESGSQTITDCYLEAFTSESKNGEIKVQVSEGKTASNYPITGNVAITNRFGNVKIQEGIYIGLSTANTLTLSNETGTMEFDKVYSNIEYTGDAGLIKINEVKGELKVTSDDAKFEIGSITGVSSNIDAVGEGTLTFVVTGKIVSGTVVDIETETGSVTINELETGDVRIVTTVGNVKVNKVYNSINVKTTSGNITLRQDDAIQANDATLTVETERGIIDLGKVVSRVDAKANNGSIKVIVARLSTYGMKIESDIGAIQVNLPTISGASEAFDVITNTTGACKIEHIPGVTANTHSHYNHEGEGCTTARKVNITSRAGSITIKGYAED